MFIEKSHRIKFLIVLCAGLLLRSYFAFIYPQFPVESDAHTYDVLGWNIATGNGFSDEACRAELDRPPGYPFFLAISYMLFGHSFLVVRLFQVIFSTLTLFLVYLIAKKVFDVNTAFYSFLIAAFYPAFLSYCGILYSETVFTFFVALFVYLFLTVRDKLWGYVILGFVGSCAIFIREEFILILLSFILISAISAKKFFNKAIYAALISLVMLTPWLIRNYRISGKPLLVSSQLGSTLWISSYKGEWLEWHNEDPYYNSLVKGLDKAAKDQVLLKQGLNNIKQNPLQYLKFSFKRLGRFWVGGHSNTFYGLRASIGSYFEQKYYGKVFVKVSLVILNLLLILVSFFGVWKARAKYRENMSEILILVLPAFVIMSVHFFLFSTLRYQVPIMPVVIIFAAYGISVLIQQKET